MLKQHGSLWTRLIILSLVALIPGFTIIAFTEYQVNRSRQAEVQAMALRSANLAASELDRIVSGVEAVLVAVSEVPDVREFRTPGCAAYLAELKPRLIQLTTVSLLDANGRFRCGWTPPSSPDTDFSDRPYFRQALASAEPVIGDYARGRGSGRPILPVALAVLDRTRRPVGVLVAAIDLVWLGAQMKERGLPVDGSVTVADRTGVIIVRQPASERFVGTRIPDAYLRLVNAPSPGVETVISQDGTPRVLGFIPVAEPPRGLYVSVGLSSEASYEAVDRAARTGALLALCGAIVALSATWWVGNRSFVRPLRRLIQVLESWRHGDRAIRTGFVAEAGEIGLLGAQLDRMMDEIALSQDHRDLLANELAHRVKNTLATVQAVASATMNRPDPAQDLLPGYLARVAALGSTHEVLTREHWESALVRDVVVGVVQPLVGDIAARFRIDGPDVDMPARETLGMTMVLHELCTNALKYGALSTPSGHVDLSWSVAERAEGRSLDMVWLERGGPTVSPPTGKTGFGSRLMARAFGESGQAIVTFDPDGLQCRIGLVFS